MKRSVEVLLSRYAHIVNKFKWLIVILWIAVVAAAVLYLPNLQTVVSRQSQTYLPNSAESVVAGKLANQIDTKHKSQSTVVVAIRNSHGLTNQDRGYLAQRVQDLQNQASSFHITYMQDVSNSPSSVASKFTSKDNTTEIAVIGLSQGITDPTINHTLKHLYASFSNVPSGAKVYFTGNVPIQEDALHGSLDAAQKTAVVTVILVLTILLIVFRSLLAPLLTLIAIGLSYVVSSGLVAWAAQHGLPVSTFTQTFLIAILMGAGTDYTMIMMNRFREELTRTHDNEEALTAALRGISKTVVFSALTVLISFAVLYFAHFGLYRSAVGISIGIFITLLNCVTLVPAVMSLMGRALYWPLQPKPGSSHRPSRIWNWTSGVSIRRPWTVLLILAVILVPVGLLFSNVRTFNPMTDISNSTSVKGFNVVAKAFGQGQVMPTTIVVKTTANLRTSKGMDSIQQISRNLAAVPGVKEVDSATQPVGKVIQGFELAYQNDQASSGLKQISGGLSKLSSQLSGNQGQNGVSQIGQLQNGSSKVTSGINSLAKGASGLATNSQKLGTGAQGLANGISKVQAGVSSLSSGTSQLAATDQKLAGTAGALANAIAAWAKQHPASTQSPSWQQIQGLAKGLSTGTNASAAASTKLAAGAKQAAQGMAGLETGASKLAGGATQFSQGASQLASGANQLASGSKQVTNGIGKIKTATGSEVSGLGQAAAGTAKMQSGLTKVQRFLHQSRVASNPGFYIPQSTLSSNKSLQQAMNSYISTDGHIAKFTVVLKDNPYSMAAIRTMTPLRQAVQMALAASPVGHGTVYIGGTTGTQANMNQLSSQDFVRTMSIVFIAIFILLAILLQSVLTPLFTLMSLAATYFVTMGIIQNIAIHMLHQPGVNWAVPFFAFLLLVALGVDYSIFLTSRFDEEYRAGRGPVSAMRHSMRAMGNVVFSAALIMAGTFGSMIATGMSTLTEIGLSVVIGLFLYTLLMLGFYTPAVIAIIGRAHAWPFVRTAEEDDTDSLGAGTVRNTPELEN
ncbi:MMPL family transporter [Alicyclobacillus sp. SO9]|uniref:MMPL family transporter n=1 Tax=Alicyclobacillus sp. SO9 TaxID=2665646 RepID=UPI0018E8B9C2|nr:MMPL family transporter [Alicyclobacillus sp. SO9]QQE81024.1 MMPL family transporter [Alicyclobacillus sp. SO9]